MRPHAVVLTATLLCSAFGADSRADSTLYLADTIGNLRTVNQSTGFSTPVSGDPSRVSFNGLTPRPGDDLFLYGVHNTATASALVKVNRLTAETTTLPFFSEGTIGFPEPFSTAIAISPLDPNVAVVTGFNGDRDSPNRGEEFIWHVDVDSGVALGPGVPTTPLIALTYDLEGTTLFGAEMTGFLSVDSAQLVTVDASTGTTTPIGNPGLSRSIQGLAFRPEDGVLFAIDAEASDNLVTLDANTGALISVVGNLGVRGPEGLAFLREIPEPTALGMLAASAACICTCRFRRQPCRAAV